MSNLRNVGTSSPTSRSRGSARTATVALDRESLAALDALPRFDTESFQKFARRADLGKRGDQARKALMAFAPSDQIVWWNKDLLPGITKWRDALEKRNHAAVEVEPVDGAIAFRAAVLVVRVDDAGELERECRRGSWLRCSRLCVDGRLGGVGARSGGVLRGEEARGSRDRSGGSEGTE